MVTNSAVKVISCLVGLSLVFDCEVNDMVFIKDFELIFETVAPVTVLSQML